MTVHRLRYVCVLALTLTARSVAAQTMTLDRGGATVVVEPYAPNVVRVSLSLLKPWAVSKPGHGIIAKPLETGWARDATSSGDRLRSDRLTVTVAPNSGPHTPVGTAADIAKIRRFAAVEFDDVHGSHSEACAIDEARDVAVEPNVIQPMF